MTPRSFRDRRCLASLLAAASLLAGLGFGGSLLAERQGAPPNRVGLCGFGETCRASGCHISFPPTSPDLTWQVVQEPSGDPLPAAYRPEAEYLLRLEVEDPTAFYLGFELGAIASCPFAENGGSLTAVEAGRTRIVTDLDLDLDFLTHRCTCASDDYDCCGFVPEVLGSGQNAWTFSWTAPRRGAGEVELEVAFNSANGDGTPDFDRITTGVARIAEEPCPLPIDDLVVELAACDPGAPGVARVALSWTPHGSDPTIVRRTTEEALLPQGPETWEDLGDESCLPLQPEPIVFFSVAETCDLGSEGPH